MQLDPGARVLAAGRTDIVAFDATFEQHCEGAVPALRGEIRYNANVAVNVTAPTHLTAA